MGIDAETYAAAKGYTDKMVEGGGGTLDYEALRNHPSINGNELVGNKSSKQLGIQNLFTGTTTEWAQLTADQKAQYTHVCFTDDTAQEVIVVANPEAQATAELTKLQVGQGVYSIPSGEAVADNTAAIEAIVNVNGCCNIGNHNAVSHSEFGVAWVVNSDGSLTVSGGTDINNWGNANSTILFRLKGGIKYILSSGLPATSGVFIQLRDSNNADLVNTYQKEDGKVEYTPLSDIDVKFYFVVHNNYQIATTETIYPMLYDARLNPTGYVPYSMTNRELTERVSWKYIDSATGNTSISLPSNYNEIIIEVFINGNRTDGFVFNLCKEQLSTNAKVFKTSYYISPSYYMACQVSVTLSAAELLLATNSNGDMTATSYTNVYAR